MQYEISIILPARNEEWLARTIQDILENKEAKTEIIVGLDGQWSIPPIPQHPDVSVIFVPEAIGQRAITKTCAKLARGKYIIKADSHCSFDKGFDRKMLEAFKISGDNVVMVPIMKNLHVYDYKCYKCGAKIYQDKVPKCPVCPDGGKMRKKMVWQPRRGTHSTAYRFDSTPHFQYHQEYTTRPEYKKALEETGLTETQSLQGSFFMCTKERYQTLNVDDEAMGSWGHQGLMVACKFWLSGGRVLVNHKTWYAHCFRTKGDVFGFPYPQSGREVQKTKERIWNQIVSQKMEHQIYPVSWLIRRFSPPDWTEEKIKKLEDMEYVYSNKRT